MFSLVTHPQKVKLFALGAIATLSTGVVTADGSSARNCVFFGVPCESVRFIAMKLVGSLNFAVALCHTFYRGVVTAKEALFFPPTPQRSKARRTNAPAAWWPSGSK